uniref:SET domain-containing protein n=1 Tax=Peronospora matthiolae TaxID=2874970 RepID=A0AAV1V165_9STRA
MKRPRKQELKAAREKNPRPDLDQFETRAVFQKRAKKGKDRLGLRRVSRKKCRLKKPKRSGCFVIGGPKWPPAAPVKLTEEDVDDSDAEGDDGDDDYDHGGGEDAQDDGDGEDEEGSNDHIERDDGGGASGKETATETPGPTAEQQDNQAQSATRQWLIDHVPVGEAVPWPTDIQRTLTMLNPDNISFRMDGAREEKSGCVGRCFLGCCRNARVAQVCEAETCSVGAKGCENRFRQRRLTLKQTDTGLGVFAARSIRAGDVVCQYYGKYAHEVSSYAHYTIELTERDANGWRVYVCAESCGSIARFIAHACQPNTNFVEVRGIRRPIISLVAQVDIRIGTEITVDYTGGSVRLVPAAAKFLALTA